MSKTLATALALLLASPPAPARPDGPAPQGDPWAPFRYLQGDWVGEGAGQPGAGAGGFSFAWELGGNALIRRGRTEVASKPKAHEDLLVIYRAAGGPTSATYYDDEGHLIRYAVEPSADGKRLVFLSEASPGTPRFRLTYERQSEDEARITFEIEPPGGGGGFRTYLDGKARRAKPTGSK